MHFTCGVNRLARYRAYPSRNYQQYALAASKVFCQSCNRRMSVIKKHSRGGGGGKKYNYDYSM